MHELLDPVLQRDVEEGLGADHVGHHEVGGAQDGPVDVRLGGEVHDRVDVADEVLHEGPVEDVALDEAQAVVLGDGSEVREVARVGQLVEDDDGLGFLAAPGAAQDGAHVVGADEARAAGHEKSHGPAH